MRYPNTALEAVSPPNSIAENGECNLAIAAYLSRQQSPSGRQTIKRCIIRLSGWCAATFHTWQPHLLGPIGVQALVAKIQSRHWSPAFKAIHETVLSGVLEECWAAGLLDMESLRRLQRWNRTKVKRAAFHQAAGRYVSLSERKALWQATCSLGSTPAVIARDKAFMVLLLCGLRREECVNLGSSQLAADGVLTVIGKGAKERHLVLDSWMIEPIRKWQAKLADTSGFMLRPVDRHGNIGAGGWSAIGASKRFEALLKKAGVASVSPHDARRTFASDALSGGVDIATVARWMGHADTRTTASYDRRGLDQLRTAAGTVVRPF